MGLLWTIVAILLAIWIAGLVVHVAGSLIWLALVAAVALALFNLFTGRRTTGV